jgi:hypothetical protein
LREPPFEKWIASVRGRYDVFFGHCSKANELGQNIKNFMVKEGGLRVLDWATDFRPGHRHMSVRFVPFTADDPIKGVPSRTAIPRYNVLLEAGYFMNAHTSRRMVVVCEAGTKMPDDLGGIIYLTIENRANWKQTAKEVARSIGTQMTEDVSLIL